MSEDLGLRSKIGLEFVAGLTADSSVYVGPDAEDDALEMTVSPELAADFELGLEGELALSCGCGCGHSDNSEAGSNSACQGCHHHD